MIDPLLRSGEGEDDEVPGHALAITTEVLNDATAVLAFATKALRADFNETLAENIYQTQLANLREQQGLATADAFGRATLNVARRLAQNAKTVEEVAAAQLLLRNTERDFAAAEEDRKKAASAATKKRKAIVGYAVAGAAVLALVVTVVVMGRKPARQEPRANGSTRHRARR